MTDGIATAFAVNPVAAQPWPRGHFKHLCAYHVHLIACLAAEDEEARLRDDRQGRLVSEILSDLENEPARSLALDRAIAGLSGEARAELLALMWFGRGDFDTFDEALAEANGGLVEAVDYIASKAPLCEYLSAGLERLCSGARP